MFINFKSFSDDQMIKAREYAAQLPKSYSVECLKDGFGSAHNLTDEQKMLLSKEYKKQADDIRSHGENMSLSIQQRMYYFLTSETPKQINKKVGGNA